MEKKGTLPYTSLWCRIVLCTSASSGPSPSAFKTVFSGTMVTSRDMSIIPFSSTDVMFYHRNETHTPFIRTGRESYRQRTSGWVPQNTKGEKSQSELFSVWLLTISPIQEGQMPNDPKVRIRIWGNVSNKFRPSIICCQHLIIKIFYTHPNICPCACIHKNSMCARIHK